MGPGARCNCNHSLAVICGVFAALAAALLVAESRCAARGGRVSDAAWVCEAASGAATPLWTLFTPGMLFLAVILVGLPVYFLAAAIGRRWLFRYGR